MTERSSEIPVASYGAKLPSGIRFEDAIVELRKNTYFHRSIFHEHFPYFHPLSIFSKVY